VPNGLRWSKFPPLTFPNTVLLAFLFLGLFVSLHFTLLFFSEIPLGSVFPIERRAPFPLSVLISPVLGPDPRPLFLTLPLRNLTPLLGMPPSQSAGLTNRNSFWASLPCPSLRILVTHVAGQRGRFLGSGCPDSCGPFSPDRPGSRSQLLALPALPGSAVFLVLRKGGNFSGSGKKSQTAFLIPVPKSF